MRRNIALIGFMGCGKTTVGRLLAEKLSGTFVDTDAEIERTAGCDIPTLFRTGGEPAFRDREAVAVREACAYTGRVIATGGGVVLRPENVSTLRESALVLWLTARPDVIVSRIASGAESRPVLARGVGDPLTHVLTLLAERGPLYQSAMHQVIDTSDRSPSQVADEISRKYERDLMRIGRERNDRRVIA